MKQLLAILIAALGVNVLSYQVSNTPRAATVASMPTTTTSQLYLIEKASPHIKDIIGFERRVKDVAAELAIHPDWLMAVMYSESQFNADVENHKGSGAVGLIQFMPKTLAYLGYTSTQVKRMSAVQQLSIVREYLKAVKAKYGNFNSLTDLYLAVLYPKAIAGDYCYSLYGSPSKAYKQNRGLDENNDGFVCKKDIEDRMKRLYPSAFYKKHGQ